MFLRILGMPYDLKTFPDGFCETIAVDIKMIKFDEFSSLFFHFQVNTVSR